MSPKKVNIPLGDAFAPCREFSATERERTHSFTAMLPNHPASEGAGETDFGLDSYIYGNGLLA